MSAALSFSIQRAGLLYGTCSEDGAVAAHFIYEPPQQARPSAEREGGAHALARSSHADMLAPCVRFCVCVCVCLCSLQGSVDGVEIQTDAAEQRRVDFIADRLGCVSFERRACPCVHAWL